MEEFIIKQSVMGECGEKNQKRQITNFFMRMINEIESCCDQLSIMLSIAA